MAPTPEETLALLMDPLIRHPISRHSFAPSHTVAGAVCHGCGQRIVALRDHRCLLCGVAAHRRCLYALSEKCKTDASLKCTSDGSHIPPAEPPSGRLDATSSPAAVLNVAVKQPLDRLWRSATRAADTKPPAAAPAPAPAPVARLREAAARLSLSGLEAPRRPRWDPDDALPPEPAPAPAPTPLPPSATPDTAAFARLRAAARRFREESDAGSELRLRVAKAAVGGMAAGAVVGGAVAGPAGAALGAKAAQIVGAGLVLGSPAATGAVVGGALGIHAAATAGGGRGARAAAVNRAARTVGGATAEPFAAAAAAARAAHAEAPWPPARAAERAAATLRDVAGLDAQARAFANFALEADPATAKVWAALDDLYKVRRADARGDAVADARFWARETAIDVEALRFAVADDDGAPIVAATDALVAEATYIHAFTALVRRNRDADATLERVLAARGGAGEGAARSVRRGAAALAKIGAGRDAHAKLRALVFCLEALGDSDEGPLVTADVLLPRAVACVAEAKVPHLRAELAYVDAFARDDVLLGAEGYALTTLSCALDVLADGDDSGEQPVLDLGGESWPAPPAPPPASPLGGEEWPEPS